MPEKTHTVTWTGSKRGDETDYLKVDKHVLRKDQAVSGLSSDQVQRLTDSFPQQKLEVQDDKPGSTAGSSSSSSSGSAGSTSTSSGGGS